MLRAQMNSDNLAVGLSTACVIHCFFAPSLIVLSYSFLSLSVDSELIHYLILLFALPISILALGLGYKNHKETSYFIIGITGLMILLSAVLFSDTLFGEAGERALTLIGSMIVAYAHYKNHSICKQMECDCHDNLKSN